MAAFCALLALACLVLLWLSHEKQTSSARMIELQEIEIESLRTALEAEALISSGSMQQLRRIAAGRSFSAFATLSAGEFSVLAFWSDDLAAGFLLLPATTAPEKRLEIKVFVHEAANDGPLEASITESQSDRILGFNQPAGRLPPSRITVQFKSTAAEMTPQSVTADWIR